MRNYFSKSLGSVVIALLCLGGAFYAGYLFGNHGKMAPIQGVYNINPDMPTNVDFTPFWKAWTAINEKFVPTSTTSAATTNQDKVWGAISGLASSLGDPYTMFFPPAESQIFQGDISGNFEGVGMEIGVQDNTLIVIAPLKGTPAEKAGILTGDKILSIDATTTIKMSSDEAVKLIRGKSGTTVTFGILRGSSTEPIRIPVTRGVIDIPTVNTKAYPGGIYKIDLYSFTATSPDLFRNALRQFVSSGDNKLIIDLRGNPGGYLDASVDMASWFLPAGKTIVRESFGGNKEEKVYRSKGYNIFNNKLKVVILVNGGSASASEILAGALSENGVAKLVGEKTFGKGSVQELVDITPTTSLKVTVARWLTPKGVSISLHGLTPDIVVPLTLENAKAGHDTQLDKALEILKQ